MRFPLCLSVAALTVSCHAAAPHDTADLAVVRAAIADWQEGPTDGHVCLDARVLRNAAGRQPATYWASAMLDSLLADSLIAVDQSTLPPNAPSLRSCLPSREGLRVAFGVPQVRLDSVHIAMSAWVPSHGSDTSALFDSPVTLTRQLLGWQVVAHPTQHFEIPARGR